MKFIELISITGAFGFLLGINTAIFVSRLNLANKSSIEILTFTMSIALTWICYGLFTGISIWVSKKIFILCYKKYRAN